MRIHAMTGHLMQRAVMRRSTCAVHMCSTRKACDRCRHCPVRKIRLTSARALGCDVNYHAFVDRPASEACPQMLGRTDMRG